MQTHVKTTQPDEGWSQRNAVPLVMKPITAITLSSLDPQRWKVQESRLKMYSVLMFAETTVFWMCLAHREIIV